MKKLSIILLAIICVSLSVNAEIRLPQLFQSGMVMQRGKPIPIWGWADKGEQITITFLKKTYTTTADDQGRWRIDLPKQKAGGPYQLTINQLAIDNVLIGDVWLLSGQSNIDVTIERVYPQYVNEIDQFDNDQVRLFRVQNETATHGVKDDICLLKHIGTHQITLHLSGYDHYRNAVCKGSCDTCDDVGGAWT